MKRQQNPCLKGTREGHAIVKKRAGNPSNHPSAPSRSGARHRRLKQPPKHSIVEQSTPHTAPAMCKGFITEKSTPQTAPATIQAGHHREEHATHRSSNHPSTPSWSGARHMQLQQPPKHSITEHSTPHTAPAMCKGFITEKSPPQTAPATIQAGHHREEHATHRSSNHPSTPSRSGARHMQLQQPPKHSIVEHSTPHTAPAMCKGFITEKSTPQTALATIQAGHHRAEHATHSSSNHPSAPSRSGARHMQLQQPSKRSIMEQSTPQAALTTTQAGHHRAEHATQQQWLLATGQVGACGVPASSSHGVSQQHPPHSVEAAEQACPRGRAPHNGDVEVKGDGHGPEEGAGVGEGGQGTLQHAVPRGPLEVPQHPVEVGEGREEVCQRQVEQELPGPAPQLGPQGVGADQQAGAHAGEHAGHQHDRPLRAVQLGGGQGPRHAGGSEPGPARQPGERRGGTDGGREGRGGRPGLSASPPRGTSPQRAGAGHGGSLLRPPSPETAFLLEIY